MKVGYIVPNLVDSSHGFMVGWLVGCCCFASLLTYGACFLSAKSSVE